ncbi:MAG: slipin family protein [Chloroflexi bacterium]|nr:slipin family protein [Chloroflexota bacterium]
MQSIVQALGTGGIMLIILLIIIVPATIKVVTEWERGVIFRFGKFDRTRGPGLVFLFPFIEKMMKADLRVVTIEVPAQEVITRDNVTIKVNAVIYFRVVLPEDSMIKVYDYLRATSQIAQTTLRSILGQSELDELLANRDKINDELQKIIDQQTEPWGVKVTAVEVKDVELPATMQRAMAKQAEAEREKRAKVIHAEGEFQAAQTLANAADVISKNPAALQLRYLQTLTDIAMENSSTIVFPVPIDTLSPFFDTFKAFTKGASAIKPPAS